MKIYTKVVIDIQSGQVLQEDSYNYVGGIAECKGGTSAAPSPPADPEVAIMERQTAILESQWAQQQEFAPFILESMGLARNPDTGVLERSEIPTTTAEQLAADITRASGERTLSALQGDLPIQSGVLQMYDQGEKALREELSSRLGSNYALTTGGGKRLEEFRKGKAAAFDAAMRGEITTGTASYLQTLGALPGLRQQQYNQLQGAGAPSLALSAGYGQALQPYQFQRQMSLQASMQGANLKNQRVLAQYQLAGSAMGAAGTAYASSKSFKGDIIPAVVDSILQELLDIDVVKYRYKSEVTDDGKNHIGVIAEDIPQQLVTSDGKHIDLMDFTTYLLVGIQQLAKKIEKLEQKERIA